MAWLNESKNVKQSIEILSQENKSIISYQFYEHRKIVIVKI